MRFVPGGWTGPRSPVREFGEGYPKKERPLEIIIYTVTFIFKLNIFRQSSFYKVSFQYQFRIDMKIKILHMKPSRVNALDLHTTYKNNFHVNHFYYGLLFGFVHCSKY